MNDSDVPTAEQRLLGGQLGHAAYLAQARADGLLPDHARWQAWAWQLPALAGLLCVIAGLIMLFASNWLLWPRLLQVGGAQAVWLLAVTCWWRWREQAAGRWAAFAAAALTGVWLAVIGQAYQTGADAWQLFAVWTLLALPWALWARLEALWMLWLALASVSLLLFSDATLRWRWFSHTSALWPLHLLWLVAGWWVTFRRPATGWFAYVVVLAASLVIAWPAWAALLDFSWRANELQHWLLLPAPLPVLVWLLVNGVLIARFARAGSLFWLACPAYSFWIGLLLLIGRHIDGEGGLMLLALFAVGSFAGIGVGLRRAAQLRSGGEA
ncbi:DUF2157 domain-containing protein [Chitinilyticum piscinae]|uniref:DUF2157 domain-containing protein n=1 Tax=Chitinilyticum piscinae TaxID=2866724 RepID=A0A8J7K7V4_9NEIS|nr:DUF2157 domain-containing protein [Chitinilyticum piscinae]MBE9608653.1 DUF2157 domain-containing protein [Chitinilyticum piscinae]